MLNKNFFILLFLIVIIGFSIGFFTGGDRDREDVVESSSAAETSDLGPVTEIGGEQKTSIYNLMMLSAAPGGHNFDVSKAVVDALGDMDYNTAVTITGGTAQNIEGLLNGQGQLAISNSDTALEAYTGQGAYSGQVPAANLKVLMSMWVNYGQLLVRADSDINSLDDLSGKVIAVDEPDSDADRALRALLATNSIPFSDDRLKYMALPKALDELEQGACDAIFMVGMLENDRVAAVQAHDLEIRAVPIDDAAFERLTALYPFYMRGVLPAGTYALPADVPTVVTVNIMLVSESVPEDVVYAMLQNLFAQKDVLGGKYQILQTALFDGNAAFDIGIPLHDGAAKFYREQGRQE